MVCKEVSSKKYQTRKSPPFHAGECKGETKPGKDGDYISKPDKRNIYKWIKVSATRKNNGKKGKLPKKMFSIHDNGSRPYAVYDYKDHVNVFKQEFNEELNSYQPTEKVIEYKYKKLLVGKDKNDHQDGNSILLKVKDHEYIHIGRDIFSFETDDEIDSYYSPIGNNDVPYPYAVSKDYTYLMLEPIRIGNKVFKSPLPPMLDSGDPYNYYYFEDRVRETKGDPKYTKNPLTKDVRKRPEFYAEKIKDITANITKFKRKILY